MCMLLQTSICFSDYITAIALFQFYPQDLFHILYTQQIVRQQGFLKKRVPAGGDAVRVPEIKAVGESGADLMVFTYHKAVFVPFRVCKADVLGSDKQVHADICAGALQYDVGLFLYQKKEKDALPAGEQKK